MKEEELCPHDPTIYKGMPMGMYHCPECGEMVIAGIPHPRPLSDEQLQELLEQEKTEQECFDSLEGEDK